MPPKIVPLKTTINATFWFFSKAWASKTVGGASRRAILFLFKSARKNMARSGKKSDAI